jgi:cobalt-zinc-cadmium efflux system outer membrane protein
MISLPHAIPKKWTYCLGLVLVLTCSANGSSVEDANAAVEASGELTLPEALTLALRQSPILAAFAWDIRAADALAEQAGLRPNPELAVEIEDVRWTAGPSETSRSSTLSAGITAGALAPAVSWERENTQGARSGFSESEFTVSIAQPIQLGRKRAKQIALAERGKDLVLWDYQTARADVLAQTASDFVEVLAAQEHVALDRELVELAKEIARTFSLRVEAGQVSPLEQSRAEVALAITRAAYEERLSELEAVRAVLASNWGGHRAQFTGAVGRLDDIRPVPALEEVEARIANNPDVARWSSELAMGRAEFTLARAQRIPDLTAALGFRSTNLADHKATQYGFGSAGDFGVTKSESGFSADRDNRLVLGFSLPLPIFDRNQGRIAAAEAAISKVSEQRRGTEASVHAELTAAHQTASGAYIKARMLQDEVMPKVDETFAKIQQGYQQGKFSYLDVLDTQRTLFEARESFLEALTRYHQGVVRMERLTGQALEEQGLEPGLTEEASHDE